MKKLFNIKMYVLINFMAILLLTESCKKSDVQPDQAPPITTTIDPHDTMVKFTLYSNRVPYIYRRQVNLKWIQDTIKTNNDIRYEVYDKRNFGAGYFVTMNLQGKITDSLHIIGEYKGKITQMASPKYQSAAYVLLDNIKP